MSISAIILAATLPVFDYATNSIARRIVGVDPAVCLSRFDDYPNCFRIPAPGTKHQAPSTNFWLNGVDFSCVSPWNDECGAQRAGTLISKRHIIFAKHFPLWKGCRLLFVGQDGEVCPSRITATKSLEKGDFMIGLLDYEVTPNIHPAKILPENFSAYIGDGGGLPIVTFNQREQVFLAQIRGITHNCLYNRSSTNVFWKSFAGKIVTGDSGNPAFMLIGNEAILIYCLQSGGIGYGPSIFHSRKEIQKAMDELCPGYKLEEFDFSCVKIKCR